MRKFEALVTLNQAVALKELGFHVPCRHYYNPNTKDAIRYRTTADYNNDMFYCSAPTLTIAQSWLRENKGIDIFVLPAYKDDRRVPGYDWSIYDDDGDHTAARGPLPFADTYEAALSDAISMALEILTEAMRYDEQ